MFEVDETEVARHSQVDDEILQEMISIRWRAGEPIEVPWVLEG